MRPAVASQASREAREGIGRQRAGDAGARRVGCAAADEYRGAAVRRALQVRDREGDQCRTPGEASIGHGQQGPGAPVAQAVTGGLEQARAEVAGQAVDLHRAGAVRAADAAQHGAHERVRGRARVAALLVGTAEGDDAAGQGTGGHLGGARGAGADQGLRRGGKRRQRVRGTPADTVRPAGAVAAPGDGGLGLGTVVTRPLPRGTSARGRGAVGAVGSGSSMRHTSSMAISSDKRIY